MTSTLAEAGPESVESSAALVVAIKLAGVVLPRYDDEVELVLGLDDLLTIDALATGRPLSELEDRPGVDASRTAELLAALEARRLLRPREIVATPPAFAPVEAEAAVEEVPNVVVLPNPVLFRCGPDGFESIDHDGRLLARLSAVELLAAARLRMPIALDDAVTAHAEEVGSLALDAAAFEELCRRLFAAGLVVPYDKSDEARGHQTHQAEMMRAAMRSRLDVVSAFDRLEEEHDERAAEEGRPTDRLGVWGVHTFWASAPASLGILVAYAKAYDHGSLQQSYDFRPRLLFDDDRIRDIAATPGVFLFSNYVWSHEQNLSASATVKGENPANVTIHGGPNTPKYEADTERFFYDHPHVDIAVHGEGEATLAEALAALAGSLGDGPPDLSPLGDVPGLSFRLGDRVVRTGDRERIADLDTIPSPILTGLFDGFVPAGPMGSVCLETNRGCPYGCTFCDWGSATLSRVRKFDLERIFAELEWCAEHKVQTVGIADANFGIFERDVEIAQKIADLKMSHGYPELVGNNYAKNTVKHLSKIIEIFTEAGIVAEGKMSMQSLDEGTLATIRRKNIKVEKYDALSTEFRRNRLPLSVDLMLGLPGSTPDTLRSDLQECIGRDVRVALHPTMLLPNSPMNDPEYREEHKITALPGEYVRETATFTRVEWEQMHRLSSGFWLFENFGILRHLAKYVHGDTGVTEVSFYERLIEASYADPESWPAVAVTLRVLPKEMVPPVSWKLFIDEVRRHVLEVEGVPDDSALEVALTVQHALLPSRNRSFPIELQLQHDFAAWHRAVLAAREEGHRHDWDKIVPPLREFGPGTLPIADPHGVCTTALDGSLLALVTESSWDFDSPVSRPRQRLNPAGDEPLMAN